MKKTIGFEGEKIENQPENYIGKWVHLYSINSTRVYSGKVRDVKDNKYILNPFSTTDYTLEGKLVYKLIKEDSPIPIHNIEVIEPTTRESLEGYLKYTNKDHNGDSKKEESSKD